MLNVGFIDCLPSEKMENLKPFINQRYVRKLVTNSCNSHELMLLCWETDLKRGTKLPIKIVSVVAV